MAYSNGYDITAVYAALKDRVGFRQPEGSGVPTLTSAVTTTNSGRYFQDFHSLVTVKNIKSTMELINASDGQLITHLENIRKAAIMRALKGVFSDSEVVEQVKLFSRYGKNDQLIENTGKFIGYEINVADRPDAAVQIDALHLYFDSAVTFNIYLFKDGDLTPVMTQPVTTVANKITEVIPTAERIIGRGKYYLGYFQADLTGGAKAYREQVECWNDTLMFAASPIQAEAIDATTFERDEISYIQPQGLNAEMSSFIDQTRHIKLKAAAFDELIGLVLANSVLEQIIYAVRINPEETVLKDQLNQVGIQLETMGAAPISDSPRITGLKQRIDREAKAVRESFYPKPKSVVIDVGD
jgi:hypothetical protein